MSRTLVVGAQVSIDGVMQAPGSATEDPSGDFPFGGWAMADFGDEFSDELEVLFDEPFALLLGRKTYEIFAGFWPHADEHGEDGWIARRFNRATKYVVSRTGEVDTGWANTILLRDLESIVRLKASAGPTLLTQGSPDLLHALFAADLVDSLSLFVVPVILGRGKKLFADGSAPHTFRLSRWRVSAQGLFVGHYDRAGKVEHRS